MLDIIYSAILGIVEGITEWLPISSTGHLILFKEWLPISMNQQVWNLFLVIVQLGAILASVILFWKKVWPFQKPDKTKGLTIFKTDSWMLWFKVAVACIPGVIFKVLNLDDICDKYFYNPTGIAIALIVFGIFFIFIEYFNKNRKPKFNETNEITFAMAFYIGLFQMIAAAFPGTSRSGITILAALLLGFSRTVASEFTFILAIPAMLGASVFELKDFLELDYTITLKEGYMLIVGVIVAFIVSVLAIKFLLSYIRKHDFKVFGYYRIALGIIVVLFFSFLK